MTKSVLLKFIVYLTSFNEIKLPKRKLAAYKTAIIRQASRQAGSCCKKFKMEVYTCSVCI